jgi:hypothetical protein
MVRPWGWFRIGFGVLAIAVGLLFLLGLMLTWFQARTEMPQYQSAGECAQQIPTCYQTLPGVVTGTTYESTNSGTSGSITVRTARGTEDIAIGDINLARDGVHTGDQVSVRYWQGRARLLIIRGDNFPTVDDPASELSSTPPGLFLFGFITAVGAASLGTGIRSWRRRRQLSQIRPQGRQTVRAVPYVGPPASERDPQTLVLRPSRRNLRTPWLVAAAFAIALLGKAALDLSTAVHGHGWTAFAVDASLIVVIGVGLPALLFSFFKTSRVLVGTHAVTLTGLGGKSCDRASVARIVEVSNRTSGSLPIPMALLLDRDDRVLLRVSRGFDIATLGRQLNVPVEGSWDAVPADELAQRYPGSVSQLTVNAGVLGAAIALVITVVVVIAVFVFHIGVNYSH